LGDISTLFKSSTAAFLHCGMLLQIATNFISNTATGMSLSRAPSLPNLPPRPFGNTHAAGPQQKKPAWQFGIKAEAT